MEFKSNAKYGEPVESGTIYECRIGKLRVSVHRIIHCEGWYLSCPNVRISQMKLKSVSLMEAIKESKEVLKAVVDKLSEDVKAFCNASIEISR